MIENAASAGLGGRRGARTITVSTAGGLSSIGATMTR
jgi:hypothetical protein